MDFYYLLFLYLYILFVEEVGALNAKNVDPGKSNDRLQSNYSYQPNGDDNDDQYFQSPKLGDKCAGGVSPEVSDKIINNLDSVSHTMTRMSKSMYSREWYKILTPEQRKARNERNRWHGWRGRERANKEKKS